MRIGIDGLFLREPHTGMGQHVRNLLVELDARDADGQEYAALVPGTLAESDWPPLRRVARARAGYGSRHLPAQLAKLWWEHAGVVRAGRAGRIDVLHTPYWSTPIRSPWPTVVTVHDVVQFVLPEYRARARSRAYFALAARTLRSATAVITVSECSKRDIIRYLKIPADRVHVIENAASEALDRVEDIGRQDAIRRRYGIAGRFILNLGANDARKNLDRLIAAYSLLPHAQRDTYQLVLAGRHWHADHPLYPDPRLAARRHGVEDRVVVTGSVDEGDKAALYSAADVFAFPSLYEGFGIPALEAMACGTPVIASDTSALPEVVGDAGVLVNPLDVDALTAQLGGLLDSPERRADLSARGLERARRFTWAKVAERTAEVYRQVATRR